MAMTFHAFCYALVRRFAPTTDGFGAPIRLLTGPEQEFRVREMLAGSLETRRTDWPASPGRAFGTRAFAGEVRAVLAKARQLGMDPEDVVAAGEAAGRAEWVSVGEFFDEYLDVLDAEGVLDYAELVHRCRILLADPTWSQTLRREIGWVFVDEYQDTDPSQVRLLQAIAGDGRDVVVVGDPDQSIYAFRGAEARGILDFPDLFRTADGAPAPVLALGTHPAVRPAPAGRQPQHRRPAGMPRTLPPDVFAQLPPAARATGRAARVRSRCSPAQPGRRGRAHRRAAAQRPPARRRRWSEMAVLVRSGRRTIPVLGRALIAAGRAGRGRRRRDPAGRRPGRPSAAARALRVAARSGRRSPPTRRRLLLTSPLGGLDSMAIRRLGRALRDAERAELAGMATAPAVRGAARRRPARSRTLLDGRVSPATAERGGRGDSPGCCTTATRAIRSGGTAEEALWLLWSGTGWPETAADRAARGGDVGRRANRDLDAVCALFDDRRAIRGGLRAARGDRLPRRGRGPADPGRHPARVRPPRGRRSGC